MKLNVGDIIVPKKLPYTLTMPDKTFVSITGPVKVVNINTRKNEFIDPLNFPHKTITLYMVKVSEDVECCTGRFVDLGLYSDMLFRDFYICEPIRIHKIETGDKIKAKISKSRNMFSDINDIIEGNIYPCIHVEDYDAGMRVCTFYSIVGENDHELRVEDKDFDDLFEII